MIMMIMVLGLYDTGVGLVGGQCINDLDEHENFDLSEYFSLR